MAMTFENESCYTELGKKRIADESVDTMPLRMTPWDDFPLRLTVEYPAEHFEAEVGFWTHVFGAPFLSLNEEHAIVQTGDGSTFSFIRRPVSNAPDIRIQWFTHELDRITEALDARGVTYDVVRSSDIQRLLRMKTPNGIVVEIWSGAEED